MEYSKFLPLISEYLPRNQYNEDFKTYLRQNVDLKEYADSLIMSLPAPRVAYYESTNYEDTLRKVMVYVSQL